MPPKIYQPEGWVTMSTELPSMPDRQTGRPRPPAGPVLKPSNEKPQPWHRKKVPQPGQGEAPPLEWFYGDARGYRWLFGITTGLLAIFLTTKDLLDPPNSEWWFTSWAGWAIVVGCGLFVVVLLGRTQRFSAGADWLMRNKDFVRTYELMSVSIDKGWGEGTLDLDDGQGGGVVVSIGALRTNEALWDLVYNGIRRSVVNGAQVNRMAVERLHLWEEVTMREQRRFGQHND